MQTNSISPSQYPLILNVTEDHFHDVKGKDIKPAKLSESISAFANADGGEVYIGIEEDKSITPKKRTWRGFVDAEEANAFLQMLNQIAPLADFINLAFLEYNDAMGIVLKIEILKNSAITKSTDGKIFIRKGAQKVPVDTDAALERLKLDKGISSYEDYAVNTDLLDITNSSIVIEFLLNVIPTAEPEAWLQKQKLIINEKPTVAGVLLFSEEPQIALPKRSAIKIFRYKTHEISAEREHLAFTPITIEGSAYSLIYRAVAKTQEIIEAMKLLGETGFIDVQYPTETLHEIITNAVLHRDYSVAADIQIRIFDNRIEVESPGRLPGHVTITNILDTQFARNQRLVRLINKFPNPPNKDVGEGLNTAFDAMRKLRLKEPEIIELPSSVLVSIPHQKLASPQETVMEYLEVNAEITNRQARVICGVKSENSMKGIFKRMQDKGLIEPVPGRTRFKFAWRKVR